MLLAAGAIVVLATAIDLFLTVFNYDGFRFVAGRLHPMLWSVIRGVSRPLPGRARHAWLSVGSAAMLPATVAFWLGLEISGFALMFAATLTHGSLGDAYYLSAGDISSLTFGDIVPHTAFQRTLTDLETIVGLATFTLALGYVVTAFDVLGKLENLHGRVRRHAEDPGRPASILARHFRGGAPTDLPSFLQALGDDLDSYDQGLRRYPVVYYFHTRRRKRGIPQVFSTLGDLLSLLRWGLPSSEPMTQDPFLAALLDGYTRTLDRLRRSFVGPDPIRSPDPVPRDSFAPGEPTVDAFLDMERRARQATGIEGGGDDAYERYREWLPFWHCRRVVLDRVADRLGYDRPAGDR